MKKILNDLCINFSSLCDTRILYFGVGLPIILQNNVYCITNNLRGLSFPLPAQDLAFKKGENIIMVRDFD